MLSSFNFNINSQATSPPLITPSCPLLSHIPVNPSPADAIQEIVATQNPLPPIDAEPQVLHLHDETNLRRLSLLSRLDEYPEIDFSISDALLELIFKKKSSIGICPTQEPLNFLSSKCGLTD